MHETTGRPELTPEALAEIERLEELYALPAARRRLPPSGLSSRLRPLLSGGLGAVLALGWVGFLVAVGFAPAPDPEVAVPLAAALAAAAFFLALGASALLAWLRAPVLAYAAAVGAGLLAGSLALACKATEHHPGAWWLAELGGSAVLTALAVAGLRRARRSG